MRGRNASRTERYFDRRRIINRSGETPFLISMKSDEIARDEIPELKENLSGSDDNCCISVSFCCAKPCMFHGYAIALARMINSRFWKRVSLSKPMEYIGNARAKSVIHFHFPKSSNENVSRERSNRISLKGELFTDWPSCKCLIKRTALKPSRLFRDRNYFSFLAKWFTVHCNFQIKRFLQYVLTVILYSQTWSYLDINIWCQAVTLNVKY